MHKIESLESRGAEGIFFLEFLESLRHGRWEEVRLITDLSFPNKFRLSHSCIAAPKQLKPAQCAGQHLPPVGYYCLYILATS
jgi:hypothetical protein